MKHNPFSSISMSTLYTVQSYFVNIFFDKIEKMFQTCFILKQVWNIFLFLFISGFPAFQLAPQSASAYL